MPIESFSDITRGATSAFTTGGGTAVITEATAARTLALTDASKYIRFTATGTATVTVPTQASVSWPSGTEVHIRCATSGVLTLAPAGGVALNAPAGGTLTMTAGMTVTLKNATADVWDVIGHTVAA